jgi:L-glutamine---4-(methylsulfanyl)-2-oxobutanoate aminotransferase
VRPRPARLDRLPEHYFARLLARVTEAASLDGDAVVDVGRGNPDIPPPEHVVAALVEAAQSRDPKIHGYAPLRSFPDLKEAIAARYATVYGVELDPETEIAVVPGTTTAIVELALCLAERGDAILIPDPGYPDYSSGIALSGATEIRVVLDPDADFAPDLAFVPRKNVAALYLNYPANPCAVTAPEGVFEDAIAYAERAGAVVVHDFAYADLVFDGAEPKSFLAAEGAKEVGVEMFSMSKSYGMAGWRLGFVVGNAEVIARLELLADHVRVGIYEPIQRAGIAALTGPQDTVAERRAVYERRRDRVLEAVPGARSQGSFFAWFPLPEGTTADALLKEHRLAVAPGEGFGVTGRGWARISLSTPDERLELGLDRLRSALTAAVPG